MKIYKPIAKTIIVLSIPLFFSCAIKKNKSKLEEEINKPKREISTLPPPTLKAPVIKIPRESNNYQVLYNMISGFYTNHNTFYF